MRNRTFCKSTSCVYTFPWHLVFTKITWKRNEKPYILHPNIFFLKTCKPFSFKKHEKVYNLYSYISPTFCFSRPASRWNKHPDTFIDPQPILRCHQMQVRTNITKLLVLSIRWRVTIEIGFDWQLSKFRILVKSKCDFWNKCKIYILR